MVYSVLDTQRCFEERKKSLETRNEAWIFQPFGYQGGGEGVETTPQMFFLNNLIGISYENEILANSS